MITHANSLKHMISSLNWLFHAFSVQDLFNKFDSVLIILLIHVFKNVQFIEPYQEAWARNC